MGLNWVEDIVSNLYKLKGYMVIENEDLPMPKTDWRRIRGHSDIDIIATKHNELVHVECQSWWGPSKKDEEKQLRQLLERFKVASDVISKKYPFLDRSNFKIRNVFVTSGKPKRSRRGGPWGRLRDFCAEHGIELVEINAVIRELVQELKKKYPKPEIVGKEEGIARFIIHLIHNDFLK